MSVRIRLRAFLSAVHGIQRSPKYNIELLTTGRRPRKLKESGMVIVIVTHFLFTEMSKACKYIYNTVVYIRRKYYAIHGQYVQYVAENLDEYENILSPYDRKCHTN